MMQFNAQARVMWALIQRDMFVMYQGLRDDIINSIISVSTIYFASGILSTYLGFTSTIVRDVMIGAICSAFVSRAFSTAVTDSFDMNDTRYIDYKRTLPLSTTALLLAFLGSYVIGLTITTLPLFILAKIYLGSYMLLANIQWFSFFIIYLASMIFISAFFLGIILCTSFEWFRFNIWQRILIPLNSFGCFLFSWKRLYAFSPLFARAILINPFTFMAEGLRAALFGNEAYISVYYCIPVLCFWALIAVFILVKYVGKRMETGI